MLVYGLGNASLAVSLGYNIDVDTYNAGLRVLTGNLGCKPWRLPTKKAAIAQLEALGCSNTEILQASYVYEPEVLSAIAAAQEIKNKYFATLPNIQKFINDTRAECKRNGFIRTWSGRKKRYNNPDAEAYKAVNAMIQGGGGDILKMKLIELDKLLAGTKSRIVNLIHDEIVFEIHKSELYLIDEIKRVMTIDTFKVPITCDIEYSTTSWAEKKEYTTIGEIEL